MQLLEKFSQILLAKRLIQLKIILLTDNAKILISVDVIVVFFIKGNIGLTVFKNVKKTFKKDRIFGFEVTPNDLQKQVRRLLGMLIDEVRCRHHMILRVIFIRKK